MSPAIEKYLTLKDGRTLAYADCGNLSSNILVIFLHGAFGVGVTDEEKIQPSLTEKGVHYVAPTLPGWGKSSTRHYSNPYHIGFASDIDQLIDNLHPNKENLKIYLSGGSFGSVPAQLLYGAPFDIFPNGRYVKGCMLLAPFSPFREDKEHGKDMTMSNYLFIGAPSQYLPFHLMGRLAKATIGRQLGNPEQAEAFVRQNIFNKMDEEEKATFARWREETGRREGELEGDFGRNMYRSVQETWDGFFDMADVANGDWGFKVTELDEEHCSDKRPVFIVAAEGDKMAPASMAKWLATNYRSGHLRMITGGHLSGIYHLNELWKEFLEMC